MKGIRNNFAATSSELSTRVSNETDLYSVCDVATSSAEFQEILFIPTDGSGWINFREFLLAMGITTGKKSLVFHWKPLFKNHHHPLSHSFHF